MQRKHKYTIDIEEDHGNSDDESSDSDCIIMKEHKSKTKLILTSETGYA